MKTPTYPYIEYRKKFCQPTVIRIINKFADKWAMTHSEVFTRLINEAVRKELEKEKELEDFKLKK